jgi:penicillin-binding protein A
VCKNRIISLFSLLTVFLYPNNVIIATPLGYNNVNLSDRFNTNRKQVYARDSLDLNKLMRGRTIPQSDLKYFKNKPKLLKVPKLEFAYNDQFVVATKEKDLVFLTVDQNLQNYLKRLHSQIRAPHAATIVLNYQTGNIIAFAERSISLESALLHADYPAASLFKIVTAASGIYANNIDHLTRVFYRGGTYNLNKYNYLPNYRSDKNLMTVGEAMGKSCNPVFGRLGLRLPSPTILRDFAYVLNFGTELDSSLAIPPSLAEIPNTPYELSRVSAGFGSVTISPLHAAAIIGIIANGGRLASPNLIEKIVDLNGKIKYKSNRPTLRDALPRDLNAKLAKMLEYTTIKGTAASEFLDRRKKEIFPFKLIGKTGTLTGTNPRGLTRWFIGADINSHHKIAIASVVINPRYHFEKPTYIAKEIFSYANKN